LSNFFKIIRAVIGALLWGSSRKRKRESHSVSDPRIALPSVPTERASKADSRASNAPSENAVSTTEKADLPQVAPSTATAIPDPKGWDDQIVEPGSEPPSPIHAPANDDDPASDFALADQSASKVQIIDAAEIETTPEPLSEPVAREPAVPEAATPSVPEDLSPPISVGAARDPAPAPFAFDDSGSGVATPVEALIEPEPAGSSASEPEAINANDPGSLAETVSLKSFGGQETPGTTDHADDSDLQHFSETTDDAMVAAPEVAEVESPPPIAAGVDQKPTPLGWPVDTQDWASVPAVDEAENFSERAAPQQSHEQVDDLSEVPVAVVPQDIARASAVSPKVRAIPAERKPAPKLDISLYAGQGATPPFPDNYLRWNRLLTERFIRRSAQEQIHLAVSPRALASVLSESMGKGVSPTDAEGDFVASVRDAYTTHVLSSPGRLQIFRRITPDGLPACVAMLALSVLAAHRMHSDDASSGAAYYIRLAALLDIERSAANVPEGFRPAEFESLWGFLAEWIARNSTARLVLPDADDHRRYIAYPLAHVPLRQLDLEKLPAFFDWAGYSPTSAVSQDRVADDLRRWDQSYSRLSQAGKDAMTDQREPAVIAQVQSELRAWDETVPSAHGPRIVHADLLLETAMRRPKLYLLVRRKEGFPQTFRSGEAELNAADSWYDPVELRVADGPILQSGLTWISDENASFIVRRLPAIAVVLAPNPEYSGFVSRGSLPKQTLCAVMCHESVTEAVQEYLRRVCGVPLSAISPVGFPADWRLFQNVRAVNAVEDIPSPLEGLRVASSADIIPQGGLRLGAGWSWMEGAPPRLLIEGRDGAVVLVNETPVEVDESNYAVVGDLLHSPGTYTIRVGAFERTIRIVQPSVRPVGPSERSPLGISAVPRHPQVLGPGQWVLLGSDPELTMISRSAGNRDSLVLCDFEPAWAVKVSSGRGASALQLSAQTPTLAGRVRRTPAAHAWASTIYDAAVRHPDLSSELGTSYADVKDAWEQYVHAARQLRRRWKSG
jgi:hypothetical protein